ncbi:MAG: hypothetical protein JWM11_6532, partial [Planctomycetaceae bacterium]|nr:hypothetical protein [Planctomycetaceae bacterium]
MTEGPGDQLHNSNWEIRFGITLAVFAAALAINDLGAGKFGDDEIKETNEKSSAYMWYQAKGIKESLAEGQRDLIRTLIQADTISKDKQPQLDQVAKNLDADIKRYKQEKKEILLGSAAVGEENWVQEIDGQMGQVIGAKDREKTIERLSAAGDIFDFATLCLQLCMVLGAIGLLLSIPKGRKITFVTVITLGMIGTIL